MQSIFIYCSPSLSAPACNNTMFFCNLKHCSDSWIVFSINSLADLDVDPVGYGARLTTSVAWNKKAKVTPLESNCTHTIHALQQVKRQIRLAIYGLTRFDNHSESAYGHVMPCTYVQMSPPQQPFRSVDPFAVQLVQGEVLEGKAPLEIKHDQTVSYCHCSHYMSFLSYIWLHSANGPFFTLDDARFCIRSGRLSHPHLKGRCT